MDITRTVKKFGGGDYTSISSAFTDLLLSGVSAGETFTFNIIVDGNSYSESISGTIPNSGTINIVGDNTLWILSSGISIYGDRFSDYSINLKIQNFILNTSGLNTNFATVNSNFGLELQNNNIINNNYGIYNSGGFLKIIETDSCAIPGTGVYFLSGSGENVIEKLKISNYATGIYTTNCFISNSILHNNSTAIYSNSDSNIIVTSNLFYNNTKAINMDSGNLIITKSTIDDSILINNTLVKVNESILYSLSGVALSGSYLYNSNINNQSSFDVNITEYNNIYTDPKFNNINIGDYRLKFEQTNGSDCVEHLYNPNLSDDVIIDLSVASLQIFDNINIINYEQFLPFTYIQNESMVFSDYNKEYKFAEKKSNYKNLQYNLILNAKFSEFDILTKPSLEIDPNIKNHLSPWDWDIKTFSSTKIGNNDTYIIPRSVINIEDILTLKLGETLGTVFYKNLSKKNITPYDKINYRGVCYDTELSNPSQSILWLIEGNNQTLIKQNAFTKESLETYPLLCPNTNKKTVTISGVIYTGVDGDYYSFIKADDPNIKILGNSEIGDFQWIPTNLNTKFDIRGITNYESNLFLTAGQYPEGVSDRSQVQIGNPLGIILWYNNNDLFYNYIKNPDEINGPKITILSSGNYYPTDLTVYEDGSLLVADYFSPSGIFKYELAYDYALIQTSYDNETKVLLREYYNDIYL